jgi:hypothetical protein
MPDAIDSLCRHGVKIQAQVANLRQPLCLKYTSARGDVLTCLLVGSPYFSTTSELSFKVNHSFV